MIKYLSVIPVAIYIILLVIELIIITKKDLTKKHKNLTHRNSYIFRFGISFFLVSGMILDVDINGTSLFTLIFLVLFIFSIVLNIKATLKNNYNKHVYSIKVKIQTKEVYDILRDFDKKNPNCDIQFSEYGFPKIVIKKEHYDKEKSILEKVSNIDGIYKVK